MMLNLALALAQALPAMASPETFFSDIDQFRANNLPLRSEREALSARSHFTVSRLLQISPRLTGSVGRSRNGALGSIQEDEEDVPIQTEEFWRITADWNVFRGGADFSAWRAARAEERAQEYQVGAQELKAEQEGAKALFRRLALAGNREAQAQLLKLKEEALRISGGSYRRGSASLQEVEKLEIDLAQARIALREAELAEAESQVALRSLFVDEVRTSAWPFADEQNARLEGNSSLDARRARESTEALGHAWSAARATHLPSIDLSFAYKESPLEKVRKGTWAAGIELTIPIWSRWETAAEAASTYAAFARAENEALALERAEALQREFLLKKVQTAQANARESRLMLEKSEGVYRAMLRSFQLGRLSSNELMLEQDRKIQSLLSYHQSRLSFHEALVDACALWGQPLRRCLRP